MMNRLIKLIVLAGFSLVGTSAFAQNGTWTWMHGSNFGNPAGSFGTQGVTAPSNDPPGVYEGCSWTDLNGNFWFFGGLAGSFSEYSAMWKYDPTINQWTWMNGPSTLQQAGSYGVQGVPSPTNNPGARSWGPACWTDNQGRLWLAGGMGYDAFGAYGMLGDLWMYDVTINQWTWMKGVNTVNNTGTYGTLLVPAATNQPPARYEDNATWVDNTGNLWLFGGGDLTNSRAYNDMWMYDIGTNNWTWMSGPNTWNNSANYGTLQVPSPSNTPGGRIVYGKWKDCAGNFWLFGGMDIFNTGGSLADMWMYNPTTGIWTWMAGSNTQNDPGNLSTQCVASTQYPAARYENRTSWVDNGGRFWQFGGFNIGSGTGNDLWMYDPNTNLFTWVGGSASSSMPGNYGTMTVPAATNYPESAAGAPPFVDLQGDLWMFGGWGMTGHLNALWRYQIDPICPGPGIAGVLTGNFISNPDTGCVPLTVNFTSGNIGNFTYHWDFGDPNASADTSNIYNPSYTYTATGTYTVSMIVNGSSLCVSGSDTAYDTIVVLPVPIVNIGNDTTICGSINIPLDAGNAGMTYIWSTGATTQTINATGTGTYWVAVSNGYCATIDTINIQLTSPPNLGSDTIMCQGQTVTLNAPNAASWIWSTGATTQNITVNASGYYWVDINDGNNCILRDSILVTVNPMPVLDLGNDTLLCPNTPFPLDAGNPGASYIWSTGDLTQTITPDSSGQYSVTVNLDNCIRTDSILLTYAEPVVLGDELVLCGIFEAELDAGNPNATSFLWSTGATTQTISVIGPGRYWVQVNTGNCILTDTIEVIGTPGDGVLYIPNTFTPNNNGLNDRFRVYGEGITEFHMMIFNRWGELIFETNDVTDSWDGKRKGTLCQIDTYVCVVDYKTLCSQGKKIHRVEHVNIIR